MREGPRRSRRRGVAALIAGMACWSPAAHAVPVMLPTDAGIQVFDSELFADRVLASELALSFTFQGPYPAEFNGISVDAAIFGADLSNGLGLSRNDSITLGFPQPGPLLAIWEAGVLSQMATPTLLEASSDGGATFGPTAVLFQPEPAVPDPEPSGYQTNFQMLDATRFGLPAGALVDALRITVLEGDPAYLHTDILAVAALPEPSSLTLVALGLVGLRLARRVSARRAAPADPPASPAPRACR